MNEEELKEKIDSLTDAVCELNTELKKEKKFNKKDAVTIIMWISFLAFLLILTKIS